MAPDEGADELARLREEAKHAVRRAAKARAKADTAKEEAGVEERP